MNKKTCFYTYTKNIKNVFNIYDLSTAVLAKSDAFTTCLRQLRIDKTVNRVAVAYSHTVGCRRYGSHVVFTRGNTPTIVVCKCCRRRKCPEWCLLYAV